VILSRCTGTSIPEPEPSEPEPHSRYGTGSATNTINLLQNFARHYFKNGHKMMNFLFGNTATHVQKLILLREIIFMTVNYLTQIQGLQRPQKSAH
jgi:hypothetical protein